MPPQPALRSNEQYLKALAQRMERIFTKLPDGTPSPENLAARDTGWSENPILTDVDVDRIKETWQRLGEVIPHHTGGFYIPGTLSYNARQVAYSILNSNAFGIRHGDMQMSRFIVNFFTVTADDGELVEQVTLALTGWEHAYRAPLWSCARLPPWFYPRPILNEQLSSRDKAGLRDLILVNVMNDPRMVRQSWQFNVAYVFGATERWFEGCLSSHWVFRNSIEVLLTRLKPYWEHERPDVEFPLAVGRDYVGPGEARHERVSHQSTGTIDLEEFGHPSGEAGEFQGRFPCNV